MENTAESMYKYFLAIIRKERTTVVPPDKWNEWMNATLLNWVKTKLPEMEFIQKRIDDLDKIFKTHSGEVTPPWFPLPEDYLHGITVMFKPRGYAKLEDYIPGKILRTDNVSVIGKNPFRKSDEEEFQYYRHSEGNIYYDFGKWSSSLDRYILYYYRNPNPIVYDPRDNDNSSSGDFRLSQNQEVVELAARKYLERITDPRHQSYAQEQISTPS